MALPVPGDRPVRAAHQRAGVGEAGSGDRPPVLHPGAWHHTAPYANNRIEADHNQLERRLRPMRELKTDRRARTITIGHGFVQKIRREHYELGTEEVANPQVLAAFTELALTICPTRGSTISLPSFAQRISPLARLTDELNTAPTHMPGGPSPISYQLVM